MLNCGSVFLFMTEIVTQYWTKPCTHEAVENNVKHPLGQTELGQTDHWVSTERPLKDMLGKMS